MWKRCGACVGLFTHMCEGAYPSALWSANGSIYILSTAYFDGSVISVD